MNKNSIDSLQKIGLTKTQAELYLLLRSHGNLRIHEITALTSIPRTTVYDNLDELFKVGLATSEEHYNYKIIVPLPLESMSHTLQEKLAHLKVLKNELEPIKDSSQKDATKILYYSDVSGARQLLWNTLKTSNTVNVYSEWGRSRYVGTQFYRNFVEASQKRNIKEQVIINGSTELIKQIDKELDGSTSRTKPSNIRIADQGVKLIGEAFIYNDTYAQLYLQGKLIHGFEIHSKEFAATQRSIFQKLWNDAMPLQDDVNQLHN